MKSPAKFPDKLISEIEAQSYGSFFDPETDILKQSEEPFFSRA